VRVFCRAWSIAPAAPKCTDAGCARSGGFDLTLRRQPGDLVGAGRAGLVSSPGEGGTSAARDTQVLSGSAGGGNSRPGSARLRRQAHCHPGWRALRAPGPRLAQTCRAPGCAAAQAVSLTGAAARAGSANRRAGSPPVTHVCPMAATEARRSLVARGDDAAGHGRLTFCTGDKHTLR
jgi:hypothetical protein